MSKVFRCTLIGLACMAASWSVLPVAVAQARFSISTDGTEVTDNRTGLIWRRCSEGQVFNGTGCAGNPVLFTRNGAFLHAKSQGAWRVPNVKELASIIDYTVGHPPYINATAFPDTATYYNLYISTGYWSSTPDPRYPKGAWAVDFDQAVSLSGGARVSLDSPFDNWLRLVR